MPKTANLKRALHQMADEGERQKPVGNRRAEGRFALGTCAVEVNPLAILSRFRELRDALLRDNHPIARGDFLAGVVRELME